MTENPYHPFVPPFRYAEEHDAILDSLSRKVGKLSGAGKLGIDVADYKDARAIRIRIGTRLAEMMNRDCEAIAAAEEGRV